MFARKVQWTVPGVAPYYLRRFNRCTSEETSAMTDLSDDARRALEQPRQAHLVTLNSDGSPQVTTVWVGLDGDEIVCAHLAEHQKVRNIRNDPRVALSIEAEGKTSGCGNYLVVYGRARITEGGAPDLLQRLAETYLGPGVK